MTRKQWLDAQSEAWKTQKDTLGLYGYAACAITACERVYDLLDDSYDYDGDVLDQMARYIYDPEQFAGRACEDDDDV